MATEKSEEAARFEDLAKRLLAVSKSEVDKAREKAKRESKRKPRSA